MVKLELNITLEQYNLLKDILFDKSLELDKKEDDLLTCLEFLDDKTKLDECEIYLKQTEKDISNLNILLHQVDNNWD